MGKNDRYQHESPYPRLHVCDQNTEYAQAMLGNMADANSEMSAISLYLYSSTVAGMVFEEISVCFHKIMIVEMHHLDLFGQMTMMLGADPRLWACRDTGMSYWSPAYNTYPDRMEGMLNQAIQGECAAIRKYQTQCSWIQDENIAAVLKRIILDEELHVRLFEELLRDLKHCSVT